ncbi:MAG: hypothetical protein HQL27_10025 [Candidatus Omnitrophica bacterium]|nr:hypothetical protein [Candidatus Omnitrophota bacterium]
MTRNLFVNVNKYQSLILRPILLTAILVCLFSLFYLFYAHNIAGSARYFLDPQSGELRSNLPTQQLMTILRTFPAILTFLSAILLIISFWSFLVSNKILGPSTRILKELDEVISTRQKKVISSRKNDVLFEDILKRVNILISRMDTDENGK